MKNGKKIEILEKERDLLKLTLDHIIKENRELKEINEDLKMTVKHNKEMLREYVESITNKDKIVQKMNSLIDHLNERLITANEYIKKLKSKEDNTSNNYKPNKTSNSFTVINRTSNKRTNYSTITQTGKDNSANNESIYESKTVNDMYIPSINKKSNLTLYKKEASNLHNCAFCQNLISKSKDNLSGEIEKINREIGELKDILSRKNTKNDPENNNMSLNESQLFNLNHSVISMKNENSPYKMNLKEKFNKNMKLKNFLSNQIDNKASDILLLVDENNNIYEIILRKDIKEIDQNKIKSIRSITEILQQTRNQIRLESSTSLNILNTPNRKKINITPTNNDGSFLDISRVTDFNNISIFNQEDEIFIC